MRLRHVSAALAITACVGPMMPTAPASAAPKADPGAAQKQALKKICAKPHLTHIAPCQVARQGQNQPPASQQALAAAAQPGVAAAGSSDVLFWSRADSSRAGSQIVSASAAEPTVLTTAVTGPYQAQYGDPMPSPQGTKLAYVKWYFETDNNKGRTTVEVRDLVTGGTKILVSLAIMPTWTLFSSPEWSPDGATISFQQSTSNVAQPTEQVKTVPSTGGTVSTVADNALAATWHPAGSLTVTTRNADGERVLETISNGVASPIAGSQGALHAAWSPDGSTIAFSAPVGLGNNSAIKVLASGGGTPSEVVDSRALNESPDWSGDGQSIYFSRDPLDAGGGATRSQIMRVPATGGAAVLAYRDSANNNDVAASGTAVAPVRVLSGMSYDFTADGHPDVVARSASGDLRLYLGTGSRTSGMRIIGRGWQGFTTVFSPGDFNGDGRPDIIGRTAAGDLLLYPWNGTSFGARRTIGIGWGGMAVVFSPGDVTGDRRPDVLGRTADGTLRLYPNTGAGLTGPRVLGPGWSGFTALFGIGDLTADGRNDIIARTVDGDLILYAGTGSSFSRQDWVGQGFSWVTAFDGCRDFTGDGRSDLLARQANGNLALHRSAAPWSLGGPTIIGVGWNGITALT